MRIAHFSDLHYCASTLDEAERCFGAAVDKAIEEQAEVAVISGDSTDHGLDLYEPAALKLLLQVRRLADHCPVLMLQGTFSHEPPGTLSVFRLLRARHPVHVADRIQQVALLGDGTWMASDLWRFSNVPAAARLLISCVPTINKSVVAATVGAVEASQAVGEHLALLLAGFAPINAWARDQAIPTAAVSHGTVFGSTSEHGVPMAGFDHEFTTEVLFGAEAQGVMLGHIHRFQSWEKSSPAGQQCIAYAGSIGRFHYGEEGEKGFLLWNIEADAASCQLMPTPARTTIDIVFEGRPELEVLRTSMAGQSLEGVHVRVRWTVADEDRHSVDRAAIAQILAGAAHTKFEGRIVPLVRARAPGISQLTSLTEKMRRWAELTSVDPTSILGCWEALNQAEPAAIVERLLRNNGAKNAVVAEQACEEAGLI